MDKEGYRHVLAFLSRNPRAFKTEVGISSANDWDKLAEQLSETLKLEEAQKNRAFEDFRSLLKTGVFVPSETGLQFLSSLYKFERTQHSKELCEITCG